VTELPSSITNRKLTYRMARSRCDASNPGPLTYRMEHRTLKLKTPRPCLSLDQHSPKLIRRGHYVFESTTAKDFALPLDLMEPEGAKTLNANTRFNSTWERNRSRAPNSRNAYKEGDECLLRASWSSALRTKWAVRRQGSTPYPCRRHSVVRRFRDSANRSTLEDERVVKWM